MNPNKFECVDCGKMKDMSKMVGLACRDCLDKRTLIIKDERGPIPRTNSTEINVSFGLSLPKTSMKRAKLLIEEMIGSIMGSLDNGDCPMDSFYEFFDEEKTGLDYGYSYGFYDKAEIEIDGKKAKKIKINLN